MAKTTRILIPSDFTIDSLYFAILAIEKAKVKGIDIILVYGQHSGRSISELLGISKDDHMNELLSETFIKACQIIQNRYAEKKVNIYTDIIGSDHANFLKNYIKGAHIDKINVPSNYCYEQKNKRFFDAGEAFLKALSKDVIEVVHRATPARSVNNALEHLFFNNNNLNVNYE